MRIPHDRMIGPGVGGAVLLAIALVSARGRAEGPGQPPGADAARAESRFRLPREPADVDPEDPEASLPLFDAFCWESFLALNTAAVPGARDDAGGTALARPGERTAWMTWGSRDDLFPADCREPRRWDGRVLGATPDGRPCESLTCVAKVPTSVLDVNEPGTETNAFIGPLVAQNAQFARFEIRFNRTAYEHVLQSKLWDWHHLPAPGEVPVEFPARSILVKAAWRVIGDGDEDFKARCFWTHARLLDPFRPGVVLKEAAVGLVGLHIVHRTPKRRQWIWSSFEHVDNVPDGPAPEPGRRYSFNYGAATAGVPRPNLDSNPPSGVIPGVPLAIASLDAEGRLKPTQVVREQPVHPKTEETNRRYRDRLAGSVWGHYKLVVTQFPTQPDDDNADPPGAPFPGKAGVIPGRAGGVSVANTSMETYVQTISCMECHAKAKGYGVSFMFSPGRALLCRLHPASDAGPPDARLGGPPKPGVDQARARVLELDRKILDELYRKVTPGAKGERLPAKADTRAGLPEEEQLEDVDGPDEAMAFDEVRQIFFTAIGRWKARNGKTCDPDIVKRHGAAFGWVGGNPWASWDVLKAARFSPPGMKDEDAAPLIGDRARTVREMLLIRVLRGEGVPQARGKRMPLNGPYLDDDELRKVEQYLARRTNKPIS